jgi:L-alanine-DL-glutamate epimerase-like enolase superfamily enzyme
LNAVLLEQPLKDTAHDEHFWLTQRTKLPIIADESICLLEDLIQHHEAYSGVNIKLIKCGGILQAQQLLNFEPTNNPNFMKLIGCMSESSLGVATAAILATQCTMADLDAPFLNKNDPFTGFNIKDKQIQLADKIALNNNLI